MLKERPLHTLIDGEGGGGGGGGTFNADLNLVCGAYDFCSEAFEVIFC